MGFAHQTFKGQVFFPNTYMYMSLNICMPLSRHNHRPNILKATFVFVAYKFEVFSDQLK